MRFWEVGGVGLGIRLEERNCEGSVSRLKDDEICEPERIRTVDDENVCTSGSEIRDANEVDVVLSERHCGLVA